MIIKQKNKQIHNCRLIDVFINAEENGFQLRGLPLSQIQQDITKFNYLDDTVLSLIKCSDDPKLAKAQELLRDFSVGNIYPLVWMTPTRLDLKPLIEMFGNHFFQVKKRVRLACSFFHKNMILHDGASGDRVPVPPERLKQHGGYYEEYLIYTKKRDIEHLQAVNDFVHDLRK